MENIIFAAIATLWVLLIVITFVNIWNTHENVKDIKKDIEEIKNKLNL